MFFRREAVHTPSFEERLANLKPFKFEVKMESSARALVTRAACGAIVESIPEKPGDGKVQIGKVGVVVGNEVAMLVSRGYQMFLLTPSGREEPALASHLHALHAFDEDLREGLGLTSLYNVSLGTTSDEHLYDRVTDRDSGPHKRPWDKSAVRL